MAEQTTNIPVENTNTTSNESTTPTTPQVDANTQTPSSPNIQQNVQEKKVPNPVLGIDFGTQRVVVAIGNQEQEFLPKIVHNNLSNDQTPNLVSFKGSERSIGEEALNQFFSVPKGTIFGVKRLLGKQVDDLETEKKKLPYVVGKQNNKTGVEVNFKNENVFFTPSQISAMILSKVKWFVEKKESTNIMDCVIAIPASFDENARTELIDAARIAGLNILGLVHDNTAAAICYGLRQKLEENSQKTIVLLDMGHSFFSAQVIRFSKDKLEVLASLHDDSLGARVFDHALFDFAAQTFMQKTQQDVYTNAKAMCRLLNSVEKTKQILSTIPETDLTVDCLMNDKDLHMIISRNTMEQAAKEHLEKLGSKITQLIEKAGIKTEQIDAVEVIGGGLRIPVVQERIKKAIGDKDLRFSLDSAHCIALGAAVMGKILNTEYQMKYQVVDPFNTSLQIQSKTPEEEIENYKKKNQELIENDKYVSKKRDAKNSIESYIYSTRSQCNDSKFDSLISSDEKTNIRELLEKAENWVYDEGATTELEGLETRLKTLKEDISAAAPKLAEHLRKEEEERKKALEEANEYIKTHKNPTSTKDKREPRTNPEKIEAAKKRKTQGNTLFKDGAVEDAVVRYTQALAYFEQIYDLNPEQKKEVDDLKLQCYSNLSMCYIKMQKYEKARDNCTMAIEVDKDNVKVLFRRGQAYYYLKDFEKATQDFSAALKLDPNNAEVKKNLKVVQDKLKEQKEKEKKMYQKMFG